MPTYSYQCDNCGHVFEQFQKFSEDPITLCSNCSKETVRRVIHPAGIIFKGSGWYVTDSRSKNKTDRNNAAKNGRKGESSGAKAKGKTETKPDTKSESTSNTSSSGNNGTGGSDD